MEMNQTNLQRVLNSVFDVDYDDDVFDSVFKPIEIGRGVKLTRVRDSIVEVEGEKKWAVMYDRSYDEIKKYDFLLGMHLNNINRIMINRPEYDFKYLWIYADEMVKVLTLRESLNVKNLNIKAPVVELDRINKISNSVIDCDTLYVKELKNIKRCVLKYDHLYWFGSLEGIDIILGFKFRDIFKYDSEAAHHFFLEISKNYKNITKQQAKEFFGDLFYDGCKKITIMDEKTFSYNINGLHESDTVTLEIK